METNVEIKFPDIYAETTENATVTTSYHCKLTLVLRAIELEYTITPIKIGVSKGICWVCQQYLEFFSHNQKVWLLVSQYQGKIHAGWRIPKNILEPVKKKVHLLVHDEVTEIRKSIVNRRKSDSFPFEDRERLEELLERPDDLKCLEWPLWENHEAEKIQPIAAGTRQRATGSG